jgi:hypothetical protein
MVLIQHLEPVAVEFYVELSGTLLAVEARKNGMQKPGLLML